MLPVVHTYIITYALNREGQGNGDIRLNKIKTIFLNPGVESRLVFT